MAPPSIWIMRSDFLKIMSVSDQSRHEEITTNRGLVYGFDNQNIYHYELFRNYILCLEDHRVRATIPERVVLNTLGLQETARLLLLRGKPSIHSFIQQTEKTIALSFIQEYQDEPSTVPSWSLNWPDTIQVVTWYTKTTLLLAVRQSTRNFTPYGRFVLRSEQPSSLVVVALNMCIPPEWTPKRHHPP